VNRSEKNDFVAKVRDEFSKSSTIIVTNYSGLNVKEIEELRKSMREHGAKFKVTKNSLTKLALANTKIKTITDLFNGPTAVAYSPDSIAPAKVSVQYAKKNKKFKIIGGFFDGEKVDQEKINFLASLLSLDEIRSKLVGLLSTPAQKIVSILETPAGQLARLVNARSKELESSK
jgi:large subunit ribosomal protein L10